MNFDLNEDEEMLKALAERFVDDNYDLDRRRVYLGGANGFSPQMWSLLAELGHEHAYRRLLRQRKWRRDFSYRLLRQINPEHAGAVDSCRGDR